MVVQRPSTVRSAAFRSSAFSFAKAISIGLKVRAVWRKESEPCAPGLDHRPDRGALVAGKVVHDHDVAGAEGRRQHLGNVGFEPVAVDRTVEDHGGDHAVRAEAGDEGRGLAVAVREPHAQSLAPGAAPVRARHVRRGPGLVDEHELPGVEIGLRLVL